MGSNITADGYIPTAVAAAVVQSVRPISNPTTETPPTTPEAARPNEETVPSAPIRPVSAFRLPENRKEPATAGSAAQFWIRDSQAINASVLHLFPQTVAGQDLAFSEDTLSLAPNGVYFVSFLLKAQANGQFVEVIPQIDLALHHEFSACAKGDSSQEPQADAVSLSCGFLVNTTACTAPTSLQFLLHTDSAQPIAVNGCLSLFKIGVPFGD